MCFTLCFKLSGGSDFFKPQALSTKPYILYFSLVSDPPSMYSSEVHVRILSRSWMNASISFKIILFYTYKIINDMMQRYIVLLKDLCACFLMCTLALMQPHHQLY